MRRRSLMSSSQFTTLRTYCSLLSHAAMLRRRQGTAVLEFVLVAGFLLLLTFSMVDFGLLLNQKLVMTHAAREGARRAAIDGGASSRAYETVEEQLESGGIDPEKAEITIRPREANYGTPVTITVTAQYETVSSALRLLGLRSLPLSVELTSRSEYLFKQPLHP